MEPEDPKDVLDREKSLEALAALRHAKWFQVRHILFIYSSPPSFAESNFYANLCVEVLRGVAHVLVSAACLDSV